MVSFPDSGNGRAQNIVPLHFEVKINDYSICPSPARCENKENLCLFHLSYHEPSKNSNLFQDDKKIRRHIGHCPHRLLITHFQINSRKYESMALNASFVAFSSADRSRYFALASLYSSVSFMKDSRDSNAKLSQHSFLRRKY